MRAAILQGSRITVETLNDPRPTQGQLLVAPILAGICGSDLHFRARAIKAEEDIPIEQRHTLPKIVPGHEFSATVIELGQETKTTLRPGDRVAALPFTLGVSGFEVIGLSPHHFGGLSTLCLIDSVRAFKIPDNVPSDVAALTEPMAVGLHATKLANRNRGPNVVIGCGPIGLAVITALAHQDRHPIIAADFSATRRKAAETLGADIVIDLSQESPFDKWEDLDFTPQPVSPLLERTFDGVLHGANIFECVGTPGLIDRVVKSAPRHSQVLVVGVGAHQDKLTPREATIGELTLEFSFAYRPAEFDQALKSIAKNSEQSAAIITSRLPLAKTQFAFEHLSNRSEEIKILIDPHA